MRKLSQEKFFKAVDFIMTHARPLDRKLFEYYFSNGSSISVLNALSYYQNSDGGCGHGIEPDVRMPESSPIASSVAMQYAVAAGATWQHPFVRQTMGYLSKVYDSYGKWPLKLPEMNRAPHADWWHDDGKMNGDFEANPGAEIAGYFHLYPQATPWEVLMVLNDTVLHYLENREGPLEFHEVLCYTRLAEMVPEPCKSQINDHLKDMALQVVTADRDAWNGYCAKPLWLAPSPVSPLFMTLGDLVEHNLDFEVDNQAEDGSWHPFWEWGQHRDVWENEAKLEWQGYLTVKTLKTLHDYGRIEENSLLRKKKSVKHSG